MLTCAAAVCGGTSKTSAVEIVPGESTLCKNPSGATLYWYKIRLPSSCVYYTYAYMDSSNSDTYFQILKAKESTGTSVYTCEYGQDQNVLRCSWSSSYPYHYVRVEDSNGITYPFTVSVYVEASSSCACGYQNPEEAYYIPNYNYGTTCTQYKCYSRHYVMDVPSSVCDARAYLNVKDSSQLDMGIEQYNGTDSIPGTLINNNIEVGDGIDDYEVISNPSGKKWLIWISNDANGSGTCWQADYDIYPRYKTTGCTKSNAIELYKNLWVKGNLVNGEETFYMFQLSSSGAIIVYGYDIDELYLYDSSMNLKGSNTTQGSSKTISKTMNSGTYYIKVKSVSEDAKLYSLRFALPDCGTNICEMGYTCTTNLLNGGKFCCGEKTCSYGNPANCWEEYAQFYGSDNKLYYCESNQWKLAKTNGQACTVANECTSGECHDGVCGPACGNGICSGETSGSCPQDCGCGQHAQYTGGQCVCDSGWRNCDNLWVTGCETQIGTTSNCLSCGDSCGNNMVCSSGCTCAQLYGNCDGNTGNGCETNLRYTLNCKSCGHSCYESVGCSGGKSPNTCVCSCSPENSGEPCSCKTDLGYNCSSNADCFNGNCRKLDAPWVNSSSGICCDEGTDCLDDQGKCVNNGIKGTAGGQEATCKNGSWIKKAGNLCKSNMDCETGICNERCCLNSCPDNWIEGGVCNALTYCNLNGECTVGYKKDYVGIGEVKCYCNNEDCSKGWCCSKTSTIHYYSGISCSPTESWNYSVIDYCQDENLCTYDTCGKDGCEFVNKECGSSCSPGWICNGLGSCMRDSGEGGSCSICSGQCETGLSCCSGVCRNLEKDKNNCGKCGNTCGSGETCCGIGCADLSSDFGNCGSCGNSCLSGQYCEFGLCTGCSSTCDGVCPKVACYGTDPDCGKDGEKIACCGDGLCAIGETCEKDNCCSGVVTNLTNELNCGTCGNACASNQYCGSGKCAGKCGGRDLENTFVLNTTGIYICEGGVSNSDFYSLAIQEGVKKFDIRLTVPQDTNYDIYLYRPDNSLVLSGENNEIGVPHSLAVNQVNDFGNWKVEVRYKSGDKGRGYALDPTICGDGICDTEYDENCDYCQEDCGCEVCGNDLCSSDEVCTNNSNTGVSCCSETSDCCQGGLSFYKGERYGDCLCGENGWECNTGIGDIRFDREDYAAGDEVKAEVTVYLPPTRYMAKLEIPNTNTVITKEVVNSNITEINFITPGNIGTHDVKVSIIDPNSLDMIDSRIIKNLLNIIKYPEKPYVQSVYTSYNNSINNIVKYDENITIHVIVRNPTNINFEGLKLNGGIIFGDDNTKYLNIGETETFSLGPNDYTEKVFYWIPGKNAVWESSGYEFVGKKFIAEAALEKDGYKISRQSWDFYADEFGVPDWFRKSTVIDAAGDWSTRFNGYGSLDELYDEINDYADTIFVGAEYYRYGNFEGRCIRDDVMTQVTNGALFELIGRLGYYFPLFDYSTPPSYHSTDGQDKLVDGRSKVKNAVEKAHENGLKVIAYTDPLTYYDFSYIPILSYLTCDIDEDELREHPHSGEAGWARVPGTIHSSSEDVKTRLAAPETMLMVSTVHRYATQFFTQSMCPDGWSRDGPSDYGKGFLPEKIDKELDQGTDIPLDHWVSDPSYHYHMAKQFRWLVENYNFDVIFIDDTGRIKMSMNVLDALKNDNSMDDPVQSPYGVCASDESKRLASKAGVDVYSPQFQYDSISNMWRHLRWQVKEGNPDKVLLSNDYYSPWDSLIAVEDGTGTDQYDFIIQDYSKWNYDYYSRSMKPARSDPAKSFALSLAARPDERYALSIALSWLNHNTLYVKYVDLNKPYVKDYLRFGKIYHSRYLWSPDLQLLYRTGVKEDSSKLVHKSGNAQVSLYRAVSERGEDFRVLHVVNTGLGPGQDTFLIKVPQGQSVKEVKWCSPDVERCMEIDYPVSGTKVCYPGVNGCVNTDYNIIGDSVQVQTNNGIYGMLIVNLNDRVRYESAPLIYSSSSSSSRRDNDQIIEDESNSTQNINVEDLNETQVNPILIESGNDSNQTDDATPPQTPVQDEQLEPGQENQDELNINYQKPSLDLLFDNSANVFGSVIDIMKFVAIGLAGGFIPAPSYGNLGPAQYVDDVLAAPSLTDDPIGTAFEYTALIFGLVLNPVRTLFGLQMDILLDAGERVGAEQIRITKEELGKLPGSMIHNPPTDTEFWDDGIAKVQYGAECKGYWSPDPGIYDDTKWKSESEWRTACNRYYT